MRALAPNVPQAGSAWGIVDSPLQWHLRPALEDLLLRELRGVQAEHPAVVENQRAAFHHIRIGHINPFGVKCLACAAELPHLQPFRRTQPTITSSAAGTFLLWLVIAPQDAHAARNHNIANRAERISSPPETVIP